ncbi:RNA-binding protein [Aestuariibacter halophilus]|uniref:RNA-binding protein n=1 Tax=Fluctibacter halophilus TaxID=226011 RepID=A0ABS8GCL8_9ALTE|nr:RNA-binding protein [Aestuariibacter halophilus]MCC2618253.1 RNA-binding protein [Aestuariibacter halophilus]
MKSSLLSSIIISIILAIVAFVVAPTDLASSNLVLAAGILIGGVLVPLIATLFSSGSGDASVSLKSTPTTLYVGNLPYKASEDDVKLHFQQAGKVHSVRLMKDRRTGKRKGYGFVEIDSKAADNAIAQLNDCEFQDRTLKVRLAKEKAND